jgi:hypothetical protein
MSRYLTWQLELRNIYLSRDIKSVSELYGQRMCKSAGILSFVLQFFAPINVQKLYSGAVGRQHFKKVIVICTCFYNVKLRPYVQTTSIIHSFGYIFIKLVIEIKKKVVWEARFS